MLSHIDRALFPDRCEVVVLNDPQRYVYPIFKNGSSAVSQYAKKHRLRILLNQQIQQADEIEIYLRDPAERFVSGINSFCQITLRDHPELDADTIAWFAENYLFLNRHYSTQFSWILNLSRYTKPDCKFSLKHVDCLKKIFGQVEPKGIKDVTHLQHTRIRSNRNFEMYTRLDQSLLKSLDQTLTMAEICHQMRSHDLAAWNYVITNNIDILSQCTAPG